MITNHIDLGQLLTAGAISIIGFFIKRTLDDIMKRLDKQDGIILKIVTDVAALTAIVGMRKTDQLKRSENGD